MDSFVSIYLSLLYICVVTVHTFSVKIFVVVLIPIIYSVCHEEAELLVLRKGDSIKGQVSPGHVDLTASWRGMRHAASHDRLAVPALPAFS